MPEINSLVVKEWQDTYICGRVTGYCQTILGNPLVLFMTSEGFTFISKPNLLEVVSVRTETKKETSDVEENVHGRQGRYPVSSVVYEPDSEGDRGEDGQEHSGCCVN